MSEKIVMQQSHKINPLLFARFVRESIAFGSYRIDDAPSSFFTNLRQYFPVETEQTRLEST